MHSSLHLNSDVDNRNTKRSILIEFFNVHDIYFLLAFKEKEKNGRWAQINCLFHNLFTWHWAAETSKGIYKKV
jgi:hypothetical protein